MRSLSISIDTAGVVAESFDLGIVRSFEEFVNCRLGMRCAGVSSTRF